LCIEILKVGLSRNIASWFRMISNWVYVKIVCPSCEGKGEFDAEEFETGKQIMVICPACEGRGYIRMKKRKEDL